MIEKEIQLFGQAYLRTYVIERSSYVQSGTENTWQPRIRPAIVVIPGGGYRYIADSEDEPVVLRFLAKGYSVFSLHYSVDEESVYPKPLLEVFQAIAHIRNNWQDYWIDPNAIVLCGFSAGAHLAGLAATQWNLDDIRTDMKMNHEQYKPNAAILCYPITNVSSLALQQPTRVARWGKMLSEPNEKANLVNYVNEKTCPIFLWHTRSDGIVPVTQSLELINRLQEKGIQYEAHIFGEGFHGLSTNDVLSNYMGSIQNGIVPVNVGLWIEMASLWINNLFRFNLT